MLMAAPRRRAPSPSPLGEQAAAAVQRLRPGPNWPRPRLTGQSLPVPPSPALSSLSDHGCADRRVGGLIYQDQAARHPVAVIRIAEHRLGQPQRDPADLVEAE